MKDREQRFFKKSCMSCGGNYEIKEQHRQLGYGPFRVMRELNGVKVLVTTGQNSWNNHDLCPDCIIEVIQSTTPHAGIIYMTERTNHTVFFHEQEYMIRVLSDEIKVDNIDTYHVY